MLNWHLGKDIQTPVRKHMKRCSALLPTSQTEPKATSHLWSPVRMTKIKTTVRTKWIMKIGPLQNEWWGFKMELASLTLFKGICIYLKQIYVYPMAKKIQRHLQSQKKTAHIYIKRHRQKGCSSLIHNG